MNKMIIGSNSHRSTLGTTFAVAEVEPATIPLDTIPYPEALVEALGEDSGALESYSRDTKPLLRLHEELPSSTSGRKISHSPIHAFIHAVNIAYDQHYPLVLSPDMIWLLIGQGFAQHVNANAETLRSHFVAHESKADILVIRDQFIRGFAGNDWEGVFTEFSQGIKAHIGARAHSSLVKKFSTTTIVETAAFEVTLMDSMQQFFEYILSTRCGIPEITLEGTPEDWESIREGAVALAEYDLDWWTKHLIPVLDQFVEASRGNIDQTFWRDFYKLNKGSGGPYINGYCVNLFPYLTYRRSGAAASPASRNDNLGWQSPADSEDARNLFRGITNTALPTALSVAPFTWEYGGQSLLMNFVAGFIGVAQNPNTLAIRPEIGWAVRERACPV